MESTPDCGNSQCKGPEAGLSMARVQNSEEASGQEMSRQRIGA